MNKEHITRGETEYKKSVMGGDLMIGSKTFCHFISSSIGIIHPALAMGETKGEAEANAAFIAEAFSVFSETDKTPRELLSDNAGLRAALSALVDFPKEDLEGWASGDNPIQITLLPHHFKNALEALNK